MLLKINANDTATAGWDGFDNLTTAGVKATSLTDWDTSSPIDIEFSVITPFTSGFGRSSLVDQAHHGIEDTVWYRQNSISTGDPLPAMRLRGSGLVPGNSYEVEDAGIWFTDERDFVYTVNGVSATYNNTAQSEPITPAAPAKRTVVATDDGSGNGVLDWSGDFGPSSDRVHLAFWIIRDAPASTPVITDVDGDEAVYPGQSFVVTGTNFGATQGTGGVDINGVAQTPTNWTDTSITCTAVRGGNKYGSHTLTVTTDAATTATMAVTQEAEPGTFAVTAASPNTTDDASLWTGLIDTATSNPITIVDGDQAWVKNPNNLTNLAIAPDGTITADQTGDFVVQIRLASEGVWGSDQTVSFTVPDGPTPPGVARGLKRALALTSMKRTLRRAL